MYMYVMMQHNKNYYIQKRLHWILVISPAFNTQFNLFS